MHALSSCDCRTPDGQLRLSEKFQQACKASKSFYHATSIAVKARDQLVTAKCTLTPQVASSFAESFTVFAERLLVHVESLPTKPRGQYPLGVLYDLYTMFRNKDALAEALLDCNAPARWMRAARSALEKHKIFSPWVCLLFQQATVYVLHHSKASIEVAWWRQAAQELTAALFKAMLGYTLMLESSRVIDSLRQQSYTLKCLLLALVPSPDHQQQASSSSSSSSSSSTPLLLALCQQVVVQSQQFWDMLARQLAQGAGADGITLCSLASIAAIATSEQQLQGTALISHNTFAAAAVEYVLRRAVSTEALQQQEAVKDIAAVLEALLVAPQPPAALLQCAEHLAAAAFEAVALGRNACYSHLLRIPFRALRALHLQRLPWQRVLAAPMVGPAALGMLISLVRCGAGGRAVGSDGDGLDVAAVEVVLLVLRGAVQQQCRQLQQQVDLLALNLGMLQQQLAAAAAAGGAGSREVSRLLGLCAEVLGMVQQQQDVQQQQEEASSDSGRSSRPSAKLGSSSSSTAGAAGSTASTGASTSMPSSSGSSSNSSNSSAPPCASTPSTTIINASIATDASRPLTASSSTSSSTPPPAPDTAPATASTSTAATTNTAIISTAAAPATPTPRARARVLLPRSKPGTQCAACGAGTQQVRLFKVCGGCDVARYCNEACQRAHWRQHRQRCRKGHRQQQGQQGQPAA